MVEIPNRAKLKIACVTLPTDINGDLSFAVKVPGIVGQDKRLIAGGSGWFDTPQPGDKLVDIYLSDDDSLVVGKYMAMGQDAATALASAQAEFPDYPNLGYFSEKSSEITAPLSKGWFIPSHNPLRVDSIGGEEELPAGMYLYFVLKKGVVGIDNFRLNLFWGDPSGG